MKHLGDITKIHGDRIEPVDCITFGSPCQDLSIAGRRAGLAGERSGLFMEAVRIIKEMRSSTNGLYPTFAVWENVPGAFSSNSGEDFRAVLEELARVEQPDASIPRPPRGGRWSKAGAIAGNGWSLAWRQLDAQYWGVPQRRKRIALVADFGGQRAAEILFERTSLSRNPDESIQTWKTATRAAQNGTAGDDRVVGDGCYCIAGNIVDRSETAGANGVGATENVSYTLNTVDRHAVAYTLKIRSGREGGGKGALVQTEKSATLSTLQDQTLFQPVVYDARGNGDGKIVPTITGDHESRITDYTAIVTDPEDCLTPWDNQARRIYSENGTFPALAAREKAGQNQQSVLTETEVRWIVRRLTPTECERLQGFPSGWTDIGEWVDTKGKKHKPADTPRYKALGNSIALPQWFWIAQKMKPYLSANATLGSLFDGIGGFPLVWETTYGKGTARWASEIEEFPIAVTKRRFGEE
nr:MAG TPA: Cytosine specific methyltransferase [Caudoviricetes sp.]